MDPQTKIYRGSSLAMRSSVNLFELPSTEVSVVSSNCLTINPTYAGQPYLTNMPLHFSVPPSSSQYMNLGQTVLYVRAKVVNADGSALALDDLVAPCNMFFYSMFKNCVVSVNGVNVANCDGQYAYVAGIPAILTNGPGEKSSELTSILYYPDETPDVFDKTPILGNKGWEKRFTIAAGSATFDMIGPIPINICQQDRYLPTSCGVTFEFTYQDPALCLDCAKVDKKYKFQVVEAKLVVKMHTINPEIVARHNKEFRKQKALYPLRNVEVRNTMVAKGSLNFISQTMMTGKLPNALIFGMIGSPNWVGSLDKSIWNFKDFNLKSITITCENDPTMTQKIEVDFKSGNYLNGFSSIFKALNHKSDGNAISRDDYKKGNTFFMFDLVQHMGRELHVGKTGNLKVSLEFSEPLEANIILLMLSVTENLMEIDEYRNVYIRN